MAVDFSGLILQPVLGLDAKYYISKTGYLSLGCNVAKKNAMVIKFESKTILYSSLGL